MSKTLTMNFRMATITLGDLGDSETKWVFNKKTGKCLNDNTMFGASRSINPIQILND